MAVAARESERGARRSRGLSLTVVLVPLTMLAAACVGGALAGNIACSAPAFGAAMVLVTLPYKRLSSLE